MNSRCKWTRAICFQSKSPPMPPYPLSFTIIDIYNTLTCEYESCRLSYIELPFTTVPCWPNTLHSPLQLLYWLCIKCGNPLVDGISRVVIVFCIGMDDHQPRIDWHIALLGPCCENYVIGGTSYTSNVFLMQKKLLPVITKGIESINFPCLGCNRITPNRMCGDSQCVYTVFLVREIQKDVYDPLKEYLEIFIDALDVDIVTPLRLDRCHDLNCIKNLPKSHKDGGFLCLKNCRRVIYCSRKCRQRLGKTHDLLGCRDYKSILDSKYIRYIEYGDT